MMDKNNIPIQGPSKYVSELNALREQVTRTAHLVVELKIALCGGAELVNQDNLSIEPPYQYSEHTVIGCIERIRSRVYTSTNDLEQLLKSVGEYLGDDVGIIE